MTALERSRTRFNFTRDLSLNFLPHFSGFEFLSLSVKLLCSSNLSRGNRELSAFHGSVMRDVDLALSVPRTAFQKKGRGIPKLLLLKWSPQLLNPWKHHQRNQNPQLRNGVFPCKGKLTNRFMYLCSSGIRRFCFGEWSFSSGDSYEWDLLLKVGEMGPEEASKLLVQTEMYVSKYTSKGRAPEFHY